ncbi:MAG: NADH-quinone oxidoreductase subunit H [Sulfurospirillaceae bacterium]|nr:NADH-quinone oxidoreductase subunit H [Sulfurospirillaceae bacterium]
MQDIIYLIFGTLFFFMLSIVNLGIIIKVKAFFGGRYGVPIFQKMYDILKLWQKSIKLSQTTSWVFFAGPLLATIVPVFCFLFLPFVAFPSILSFDGDFLLFVYMFGLLRFFTTSSALDTGSSFEGMGSARELTFSFLVEPIMFVCFIILAKGTSSLSLEDFFGYNILDAWSDYSTVFGIVVVCFFVIMLAENSRIPFDDPATHLELTMTHEVMVLDHSGPLLASILVGSAMKLTLFAILIVDLAIPFKTGILPLDTTIGIFAVLGMGVVVGITESVMARLRLTDIKKILMGTLIISLFGIILISR